MGRRVHPATPKQFSCALPLRASCRSLFEVSPFLALRLILLVCSTRFVVKVHFVHGRQLAACDRVSATSVSVDVSPSLCQSPGFVAASAMTQSRLGLVVARRLTVESTLLPF
jgi:hypothetical protein